MSKIKAGLLAVSEDEEKYCFLVDRLRSDQDLELCFPDITEPEALAELDVVIGILSIASLKDEAFLEGLKSAVEKKVRLSPVVIDETIDFAAIPESINSIQWIELWDHSVRSERMERLVRALKTDFEHLEQFRKYEKLADTWFSRAERPDHLLRGQALSDAEAWLRRAKANFPRPTEVISRFVIAGRTYAEEIRRRNERILRIFWTLIGVGAVVCFVFAALIFRDTLRIQEAEREADLRKQQSQELIEYMVGELDEQLTKMGETELLAGIIDKAETYVGDMQQEELDEEEKAFKERLEALIQTARSHLPEEEASEEEDSEG
ncbi:MAG: hypothetical protein ACPGN3_10905 [Opitutales bacterium]